MAAEWIKMRVALDRDPAVIEMAASLAEREDFCRWLGDPIQRRFSHAFEHVTPSCLRDIVIASLLRVWGAAIECGRRLEPDSNDCVIDRCTFFSVDEIACVPGFSDAMASVGWLVEGPSERSIMFPKLLRSNVLAKERKAESRREKSRETSRRYRERHASHERHNGDTKVTRNESKCDAKVTPREEKRREEKSTTPQPPSRGGGRKPAKSLPRVPDTLAASPEFVEAWGEWTAYRREIGKTLKPTTAKAQFARLEAAGPVDGAAMLRQSIANGWTGIFAVGGDRARANGSPGDEDNRERNMRMLADIENGGKP